MTTPDFEKYGYEPDHDGMHRFSYINQNYRYGLPYRIGANVDGEGGWVVFVQWQPGEDPADGQRTTYEHIRGDLHNYTEAQSEREKRFDAAMAVERAMREYSEENYGPSKGGDFDFGGGSL